MSTDLDPLLKRLHLANTRRVWRELVQRAEQQEWSHEQLLQTLLAEEVAHRRGTRLERAVRAAKLPFLRTIEEFDFSYQSTLRLTTIGSLLSPDFVTEGHSAILHGKTGRGKTHLAIAIAYRAMQNGFDALFVNCAELIEELSCASRDGQLREALPRYLKPHLLIVDEVGYLTYGDDAANVLFHVVNERHTKKRSMLFTTNKHPKRWGPVLHDEDLAEAIVDRILDRGRLLPLDGPSVRTKHLAGDAVFQDTLNDPESRKVSGTDAAEFPEPTDPTQTHGLVVALVGWNLESLNVHATGLDPAHVAPTPHLGRVGLGPVFAHHQVGLALAVAAQDGTRAEVAVGHVDVSWPHGLQQLGHQGALVLVGVFTGQSVHDQIEVVVVDHQGLTWQRRAPEVAQELEPLVGRGQLVAIEDTDTMPWNQRCPRGTEGTHDGREPPVAASDHGPQHAGLGAMNLAVKGLKRSLERVALEGGVERGLQAEHDVRGEVDDAREEQLFPVSAVAVLVEDLVEPGRVESPLDGEGTEDRDRTVAEKASEALVEHGAPVRQGAICRAC